MYFLYLSYLFILEVIIRGQQPLILRGKKAFSSRIKTEVVAGPNISVVSGDV